MQTSPLRPRAARALFFLFTLATPLAALGTVVTNTNDTGPGSLRQAVADATSGDTVTFHADLDGATITLDGTPLLLEKDLTIDASALPGGITIDADKKSRVMVITSGHTVYLRSLTLTGGRATEADHSGAAIFNDGSTVTLTACTLAGNSATVHGGAIHNNGTMTVNQSTFAGNSASFHGGAIHNNGTMTVNKSTLSGNSAENGGAIYQNAGTLTLNQSTVSGNSAHNTGGGIRSESTLNLNQSTVSNNSTPTPFRGAGILTGGTVTVANSIVAGNVVGEDVLGSFTANGINLIDVDPLLAPLGDYGGPTATMPPLPGSPAIDPPDGDTTSVFATDQRGMPRAVDGNADGTAVVDIGAVEALQGADLDGFDFTGFDLSGVNLSGASLIGADLSSNELSATNLDGARYNLSTGFPPGFDLAETGMIGVLTQSELAVLNAAAVAAGEDNVTGDPASFGLFDEGNVQDLAFGRPLLRRDPESGRFLFRFTLQQAPDLESPWVPVDTLSVDFDEAAKQIEAGFDPPDAGAYFYRLHGGP